MIEGSQRVRGVQRCLPHYLDTKKFVLTLHELSLAAGMLVLIARFS